jgi:uncharacterized protein
VTDEDGDTPLYTAESLEVAKWLVEHGATVDRVNSEGISVRIIFIPSEKHTHWAQPTEHLAEDFPAIARYLSPNRIPEEEVDEAGLSEYAQQQLSEELTDRMMVSVQEIMTRAEQDGHDPEEELTALVRKTVLESLDAGIGLVEQSEGQSSMPEESQTTKKRKTDE